MLGWVRKGVVAFVLLAFASPVQGKEFRLGVISDKPVGRINEYGPLARYVAERLKAFGVTGGKMVIAKDTGAMAEKLRRGEVDVVFESAFPTIELEDRAGIIPRLLVWKKGSSEYRSVIFVRRESPIRSLDDLKGTTIVFEDPRSTSAYLLPKAELKRNGLTVLPLEKKEGPPEAVRFVFAGEEKNEAFFVLKRKTDAGAFSSDDWRELPQSARSELRVIHETKPVLRYVASLSPALPPDVVEAIESVLVQMAADPDGRKILRAAQIGRIEPLSDQNLQSLREVEELIDFLGE